MYIIILILFLCLSILDFKSISVDNKKKIVFILFIFLTLVDGLRYEIGTDWDPYFSHFQNPLNVNFDTGYQFLVLMVKSCFDNYNFFLIIHAIIIYFCLYYTIFKLSNYSFIALTLLYATLLPVLGANRQLLALAICVMGIKYIKEQKILPFSVFILLALSMHWTAIIFFPAYFLYRKINYKYIIFLFITIIIFRVFFIEYFIDIFSYLFKFSDKQVYFKVQPITISYFLGIFKRLIILLVPILILFKTKNISIKNNINFHFYLNCNLFGLLIYLVCYGTVQVMVSRGNFYYAYIFEPLLISFIILQVTNKKIYEYIGYIFLCLYSSFTLFKGIQQYEKGLFIPYNSVLEQNKIL